ncbi:diacylglycerol kinase family protein [Saccharothrix sp. 6-C]|uniref:diacylglycerol/lipid kinase family protein n=1 Tax=Saccharothrix sp. 6-C TaxID=2781735 RepID=UPI001917340C
MIDTEAFGHLIGSAGFCSASRVVTHVYVRLPQGIRSGVDLVKAVRVDPRRDGLRVAVVVHPVAVVEHSGFRDLVSRTAQDRGWCEPRWFETTRDDAGTGVTALALRDHPHLVLACGGDGTVNAVATGLAHTGVAMGIVPIGTGNLVARNLGIGSAVEDAVASAFDGVDRRVDMGLLDGRPFVGMGGIGLDAEMVRDTSPRMKRLLGWPAYLPAVLKGLRSGASRVAVRLDDGPWLTRRVLGAVVGNIGALQGGVSLLPEADPADGLLDLALLRDVHTRGWLVTAGRLIGSRRVDGPAVERFRFRRLELRSNRTKPFEVDGEVCGTTRTLKVEVDPGALVVKVPA